MIPVKSRRKPKYMDIYDFPIGSKVELVEDYQGLQEGATGIVVSDSGYDVLVNNIQGDYYPYCEDCESSSCGCKYEEEFSEYYSLQECWYIPKQYLKVISVPQTDTLILLL